MASYPRSGCLYKTVLAEKPLKKRVLYIAASLFAIWHSGALIIAPAPESYLINSIYRWYKPYLSFFNINNGWAFFAPNPHTGVRMYYILRNTSGEQKKIDFTSSLRRQTTVFQRYTMMQDYLSLKASPYTQSAAMYLCGRHKDFDPVSLRFEFHRAAVLKPEQYLQGLHATDEENLIIEQGDELPCNP